MRRLFVSFLSPSTAVSTPPSVATRRFMIGLCLLLASCSVLRPTATRPPAPDPLQIPWEDRSIFRNGLVTSAQSALDDLDNASIYHIELKIAKDLYHITGTEEVRYTNAETDALSEVRLRLFPNVLGGEMTVSNLKVDGESVDPGLELDNSLMLVPFSSPLEPGRRTILQMDFAVTVPRTLVAPYGVLAYAEDVLALAHAYPMIAVYDDEGWNAEIPAQSGDVTYADASFYIVRVDAPKDVVLVTSGYEVSHDEAGQVQTSIVASGPARDFYLAASRLYEEISQTSGDITIHSYAPRHLKDGSQWALKVASRAIEDFSVRYAAYPYTELDIVATPTLAGGIEYPGIIVLTSRRYDIKSEDTGASSKVQLEGIAAHEVGHQWFYNLVGDDQLDDPWLDEALAQFATLQYYADEYGPGGEEGFRRVLQERWEGVSNARMPIGLPVAAYSAAEYGAIVYGRGPLFFVALRDEMGKEVFDEFINDYTETLSWDIATPEKLKAMAEQHCGCDLTPLFEEWVY